MDSQTDVIVKNKVVLKISDQNLVDWTICQYTSLWWYSSAPGIAQEHRGFVFRVPQCIVLWHLSDKDYPCCCLQKGDGVLGDEQLWLGGNATLGRCECHFCRTVATPFLVAHLVSASEVNGGSCGVTMHLAQSLIPCFSPCLGAILSGIPGLPWLHPAVLGGPCCAGDSVQGCLC